MPLDTNIPLMGRGLDLATPAKLYIERGRQKEQDAQAKQASDINQQLSREQLASQKINNLNARDKQRLSSSVIGAAQLNQFLEAGDTEGAKNFLSNRRANLEQRIAAGENIDTTETDDALKLINENPEQLKQITKQAVELGRMTGILTSESSKLLSPAEFEQQVALKRAGKPETNVNVDTSENAFAKEFGKKNAEQFIAKRQGAQEAVQSLQSNIEAKKLLDSGVITGIGANYLLGLGKALQQAGFTRSNDAIANTEAFIGERAKEVGRIIKLFGAGTGLSDADREFARKAAAGEITMTEESIRRLLDINEKVSKNAIDNYNKEASQVDPTLSPFDLRVELPQGLNSSPAAVDYKSKYGLE